MADDSGEEEFGAKALHQAQKRKFDYSFSSSSNDEEDKLASDEESADEIKQALLVQKPNQSSVQDKPYGAAADDEIPIHSKVIAEEEASEAE